MSILRNELQTLLKDLEFELTQWQAKAEFLAPEDPTHIKIHERLRVVVALQTALLNSIGQNGFLGKLGDSTLADFGDGQPVAAFRARDVERWFVEWLF